MNAFICFMTAFVAAALVVLVPDTAGSFEDRVKDYACMHAYSMIPTTSSRERERETSLLRGGHNEIEGCTGSPRDNNNYYFCFKQLLRRFFVDLLAR